MKKEIFIIVAILVVLGVVYALIPGKLGTINADIKVDSPVIDSQVMSPLKVTGQAHGKWYFEAVFPAELQNAQKQVIAHAQGVSLSDWMTDKMVPFEADFTFPPQPSGSRGYIVLKKDNPSGLPANDASLTIPVYFK